MKQNTGVTETAFLITLFTIPPTLLSFIGFITSYTANGAWINCIVCFAVSLLSLLVMRGYFSKFKTLSLIESSKLVFGKFISKFTGIILCILIFLYTLYSFQINTNALWNVDYNYYSKEFVSFLPLIAAVICALFGIEALTRSGYIGAILIFVIIIFMAFITLPGWNTSNLYPIFGTNIKSTFGNPFGISAYGGLLSVFLLVSTMKNSTMAYRCGKKAVITSFVIIFALYAIYTLCVPFPMGRLYDFSMNAIFSSAQSGQVFHRFEIFLLILWLIPYVFSTSLGLMLCAYLLSGVVNMRDYRPMVLLLGTILYFLQAFHFNNNGYIIICCVMMLTFIFYPLILNIAFSGRKVCETDHEKI